jgi:hypothetical protein
LIKPLKINYYFSNNSLGKIYYLPFPQETLKHFQRLIITFVLLLCILNTRAQLTISNVSPANNSTLPSTNANLSVSVSDPQDNNLSITYYIRPCPPAPGPDFTIIGLPDTQYYTGELNGGTSSIFKSQTNWIVNNRVSENIVFAEHLGDCVENGDNIVNEWKRCDTAMKIIENPATTSLTFGIPYGMNVGNHDQTPTGSAAGTTNLFNQYFGSARFNGRTYYGGHFGSNNNNNYILFTASGLDFIVINLEYNPVPSASLVSWVQSLLTTYANRRAIIGSHFLINTGGAFGFEGDAVYAAVKNYPNVFLMLCGHVAGEGQRTDIYNGNKITTLLSDYQDRTNGGNGWLRIMKFSPANNTITVKTYSPFLNQYETDANSQFTLTYDMQSFNTSAGSIQNVSSGSTAVLPVSNLGQNTCYQWYAKVSNGTTTATSPVWTFTTGNAPVPVTLNLKLFIEGFYRGNGTMASVINSNVTDSVTLELHNIYFPYSTAQTLKAALNTTGNASFAFSSSVFGNSYYLVARQRNSIETWSASPVSLNASTISYDFSTAASKAFGSNQKNLNDGRFALYSGDIDQSGAVNLWDYIVVQNASNHFYSGLNVNDLTGDGVVASDDFSLVENNVAAGVQEMKP